MCEHIADESNSVDKQPQVFHIPSKAAQEKDMPSRLASSHPDIQHALDAIIPSKKMDVATRIVLWAATDAGIDPAEIMVTLSKLDPVLFDNLCSEMELQYFKLFELGDEMHRVFFCKARAYSASAWLAREAPGEAIYESIFATDRPVVIADFL